MKTKTSASACEVMSKLSKLLPGSGLRLKKWKLAEIVIIQLPEDQSLIVEAERNLRVAEIALDHKEQVAELSQPASLLSRQQLQLPFPEHAALAEKSSADKGQADGLTADSIANAVAEPGLIRDQTVEDSGQAKPAAAALTEAPGPSCICGEGCNVFYRYRRWAVCEGEAWAIAEAGGV